jgi:hypothetical protein
VTTTPIAEMTEEEFATAVSEAIQALNVVDSPYDFDQALSDAGGFVAQFGSLGDCYEEPNLSKVQFGYQCATALSLLSHWSVERNDPEPQPPTRYEEHRRTCQICGYLEGVYSLYTVFKYELCHECGLDLDQHDIGVSIILGIQVHAMCREPWQRCEPEVMSGGDCGGDCQIGDAFDARWTAPLPGGLHALVTRYFYIVERDGLTYIEQQIEFLVCSDLSDPGNTEVASAGICFQHVDPPSLAEQPRIGRNLVELAQQAEAPERGLWAEHMPDYPDFVWGGEGG